MPCEYHHQYQSGSYCVVMQMLQLVDFKPNGNTQSQVRGDRSLTRIFYQWDANSKNQEEIGCNSTSCSQPAACDDDIHDTGTAGVAVRLKASRIVNLCFEKSPSVLLESQKLHAVRCTCSSGPSSSHQRSSLGPSSLTPQIHQKRHPGCF